MDQPDGHTLDSPTPGDLGADAILNSMVSGGIAFLLFGTALASQPHTDQVEFCELIREADRFDGHRVVFEASYRYGFEWEEIFCISCLGPQRVWLEVKDEPSKRLNRQLKRLPKHSATINATFTGIFRTKPGAFGDGGYKYQLELLGLENIEIVSKKSPAPEYLPPKEKKRLHRCHDSPPSR